MPLLQPSIMANFFFWGGWEKEVGRARERGRREGNRAGGGEREKREKREPYHHHRQFRILNALGIWI